MFYEDNGFKLNIIATPILKKDHKPSSLSNKEIFLKSSKIQNVKFGKDNSKNKHHKSSNSIKIPTKIKIPELNFKKHLLKPVNEDKKSLNNQEEEKDIIKSKIHLNRKVPKNISSVSNSGLNKNLDNTLENPDNTLQSDSKFHNLNNDKLLKRKRTDENVHKSFASPRAKIDKRNFLNFDIEIPRIDQSNVQLYKEDVFSNHTFDILGLHPFMLSNLEKLGIKKMTSVQHLVIPHILNGSDVLVKSQTGSGKTFAYSIPIVQKLQSVIPKISRSDGTFCIIVVPTRELALQTLAVLTSLLSPFVWVVPGCLIGGEKRKSEKARIKKGINIMIATPGRLVDHLDSSANLELGRVQYFILDEADRMLDMGFEKDIARIVSNLKEKGPKNKQTLLLSATLTKGVEKLAGITMKHPLKIDLTINSEDENGNNFSTPTNLKHFYAIVPTKLRLVTLATFLLSKCHFSLKPCKILCFMATQDSVEYHHSLLEASFNLGANEDAFDNAEDAKSIMLKLYGNMDQKDRTKIFTEFHKAKSGILFSTDVAARGLDLAHVDWIIQFNCPSSPVDYIHRVGRTARCGAQGCGLLFLTPSEADYMSILNGHNIQVEEMKIENILEELIKFNYKRKLDLTHKGINPFNWQEAASFLQSQFEEKLCKDVQLRTQARKAYNSFIKSYTTYPANLKKIFHVKNLHLGHVATSFAISEPPGNVSRVVSRFFKRKPIIGSRRMDGKNHSTLQSNFKRKNINFSWMSEFDSGL